MFIPYTGSKVGKVYFGWKIEWYLTDGDHHETITTKANESAIYIMQKVQLQMNQVNHMIKAYPRVLKLLGQKLSGQKDSGIMELNKCFIGRLHNHRRPTGSGLHTLFIVQKIQSS